MKYTNSLRKLFNLLKSKKKQCKECWIAAFVMLFVFTIQYLIIQFYSGAETLQVNVTDADLLHTYSVSYVIDGDTFVYLDGDEEKTVRLLGVDTPETKDPRVDVQCFGEEASNETKRLLQGKTVHLVADTIGNTRDKYGRELRYVYLSDETFLNAHLLQEGFATATPEYTFSFKDDFVNMENEARIAEKGLWNPNVCPVQ